MHHEKHSQDIMPSLHFFIPLWKKSFSLDVFQSVTGHMPNKSLVQWMFFVEAPSTVSTADGMYLSSQQVRQTNKCGYSTSQLFSLYMISDQNWCYCLISHQRIASRQIMQNNRQFTGSFDPLTMRVYVVDYGHLKIFSYTKSKHANLLTDFHGELHLSLCTVCKKAYF